jgi:hypothetical protein
MLDGLAPTTAEAYELADLPRPWEHPNFWHYMYQYVQRSGFELGESC